MRNKGQLFSVDFLFSFAIVVLAIGILLNVQEARGFSFMQDAKEYKLRSVGELASDLLVNNTAHTCELLDESGNNIGYLNNCLTLSPSKKITKENLGIGSAYGCRISIESIPGYGTVDSSSFNGKIQGCYDNSSTAPSDRSVYSSKRLIVFINSTSEKGISNSVFGNCKKGSTCPFIPYYIILEVWEA